MPEFTKDEVLALLDALYMLGEAAYPKEYAVHVESAYAKLMTALVRKQD